MTLEEKLKHLQEASMKEARSEGNKILSDYKQTLDEMFEEYKKGKKEQLKIFMDAEKVNVKQSVNKALAYEQLRLKKELDEKQLELKEQLFEDIKSRLLAYKNSKEYKELLVTRIKKAKKFAKNEELKVYIDPSDKDLLESLQKETEVAIFISDRRFFGGIRAVVPSKNILIEESFENRLKEIVSEFTFKGGE